MISYGAHSGHSGTTTQTAFLGLEKRLAFGDQQRMAKYRDVDVSAMREAYERGEVVVGRRPNTNNNIVLRQRKTEVGKSKWQFPVQGDATSLTMGDPVKRDPLSAGDVIFGWAERPPPKLRERGRDFVRLNKWSQGSAATPAGVSHFRTQHDIRLQPPPAVLTQLNKRPSRPTFDKIPETEDEEEPEAGSQMKYTAPGARELMSHQYELDWLRQQVYLRDQREARLRRKEEIRELAKRVRAVPKDQKVDKKADANSFVMKRFRDVPSRLAHSQTPESKPRRHRLGQPTNRPTSPPTSFFDDGTVCSEAPEIPSD